MLEGERCGGARAGDDVADAQRGDELLLNVPTCSTSASSARSAAGTVLALELEVRRVIVLDQRIASRRATSARGRAPARRAHAVAGRVVVVRHEIDEPSAARARDARERRRARGPSSSLGTPRIARAAAAKTRSAPAYVARIDEDVVARIDQRARDHIERLLAPGRHEHVVGRAGTPPREVARDRLAELAVSFFGA